MKSPCDGTQSISRQSPRWNSFQSRFNTSNLNVIETRPSSLQMEDAHVSLDIYKWHKNHCGIRCKFQRHPTDVTRTESGRLSKPKLRFMIQIINPQVSLFFFFFLFFFLNYCSHLNCIAHKSHKSIRASLMNALQLFKWVPQFKLGKCTYRFIHGYDAEFALNLELNHQVTVARNIMKVRATSR